jgi:hypothetical protein
MSMKCGQSDDAKNEYANQLQKTNKLQQTFYETALPEVSVSDTAARDLCNFNGLICFSRYSISYKNSTNGERGALRSSSKAPPMWSQRWRP